MAENLNPTIRERIADRLLRTESMAALAVTAALASGAAAIEQSLDTESASAKVRSSQSYDQPTNLEVATIASKKPKVRTSTKPLLANVATRLIEGDTSYFADPRMIIDRQGDVILGAASKTGNVHVIDYDLDDGKLQVVSVGNTGNDDHNNPAFLEQPDGRITTFFSPHSGKSLPKGQTDRDMYYRTTKQPGDIRSWGPIKKLDKKFNVNKGAMGYTYPNPVKLSKNKDFFAFRGGAWHPTFSILTEGNRRAKVSDKWSPAREIVKGEQGKRPYAKYAEGPAGSGSVHMAYTDAHPVSSATGIHYAKYVAGKGFFGANGRFIAGNSKLPFNVSEGDTVRPYNEAEGSSWVYDVSDDGHGNPVMVYATGMLRPMQTFYYARWNPDVQQWQNYKIADAFDAPRTYGNGPADWAGGFFMTGGAVINHNNPSQVELSRIVGGKAQVELWETPDNGPSWEMDQKLSPEGQSCFRPAIARKAGSMLVTAFVCGEQKHWTDFKTSIYIRKVGSSANITKVYAKKPKHDYPLKG